MIAPWYLRFAADVFQRPAFLPVSSRAFALGAAAPLLFAAAGALAQLPVAIEQPPKPELAMKMVYGGSSWRDARVAAFFGGRSPTLRAEVREVFRVPKVGSIAGCMVTEGRITRAGETQARLLRDNVVVHEGKIGSLRRFKDDVSEVKSGFECGIGLANYNDIKVGDVIEIFTMERVAIPV